jgi:5'/3'-nucleotidase SurE
MKKSIAALTLALLLAQSPARGRTLRVLVTNDDGVAAPGISALVDELLLDPNLVVTVIAPATNQSATSDDFTAGPLHVAAATTASGTPATAVSGFPADAVLFGLLSGTLPQVPDLVISGINAGQNIGRFVAEDLSGTVGAALTAARLGVPAIAVSLGVGSSDYDEPAHYVANVVEDFRLKSRLARKMLSKTGLDQRLALNINFPNCKAGSVRGVAVVPLAQSQDLLGRVVTGYARTGPGTYQPTFSSTNALASDCTSALEEPTTDIEAMMNGFASVTPLNPTLTADSKSKDLGFLTRIPFE